MRVTIAKLFGLCVVLAASVVSLSGQRGTPQPQSTSPSDIWNAEVLAKPRQDRPRPDVSHPDRDRALGGADRQRPGDVLGDEH
jgi:hypothetical protein